MKRIKLFCGLFLVLASAIFALAPSVAEADVPHLINFQGILKDGSGNPVADAVYVIRFRIYDDSTAGANLWEEFDDVQTTGGLFNVRLGDTTDLPAGLFEGNVNRFVGVKVGGDPEAAPRTRLISAPFAFHALKSDSAATATVSLDLTCAGCVDAGDLATNSVGSDEIANASITSADMGASSVVGGLGGSIFDGTITIEDLGTNSVAADEIAAGAVGTSEIDATQVQRRVTGTAPVGEYVTGINQDGSVVTAADQGSGGPFLPLAGGTMNGAITNTGDPSITMGKGNFGSGNTNAGANAFVAGKNNTASGDSSNVGGGSDNLASGRSSTISGGRQDTASASYTTVAGGLRNMASDNSAAVGGGQLNRASAVGATIGGGLRNEAIGTVATVGGGQANVAEGGGSTVGGGQYNKARGFFSVIAGGGTDDPPDSNQASADLTTIGGGANNLVTDTGATVSGGRNNKARGRYSVVSGGGARNPSDSNAALGDWSVVAGGKANIASGDSSTVSGGAHNTASFISATVSGGRSNTANNDYATVGGGDSDTASGQWATVPGGRGNKASGFYSFAAGRRAKATFDGSFVWGDATDADFASTAANQFLIRAANVGIGLNNPSKKLEVAGSIKVGTNDSVFSSYLVSNSPLTLQAPAGTTRMYIDDLSGSVGIGTSSPSATLHIFRSSFPSLAFDDAGATEWSFTHDGSNLNMNEAGATRTRFLPGGSVHFGITGGNVGIGTTTPANKLDVEGGAAIGATYSGTNAAPANGLLVEGNVGIGTTAPALKLDVVGNARVSGTLAVGGGPPILQVLSAAFAGLDFPATAAQSSSDFVVAVAAAVPGDVVSLGISGAGVTLTNSCYTAFCVAAGSVIIRFNNYAAGAQNPAAGTFRVMVTKF